MSTQREERPDKEREPRAICWTPRMRKGLTALEDEKERREKEGEKEAKRERRDKDMMGFDVMWQVADFFSCLAAATNRVS